LGGEEGSSRTGLKNSEAEFRREKGDLESGKVRSIWSPGLSLERGDVKRENMRREKDSGESHSDPGR